MSRGHSCKIFFYQVSPEMWEGKVSSLTPHLVIFEQKNTKALLTAQQSALVLAFCFSKPVIYHVCTDRLVVLGLFS